MCQVCGSFVWVFVRVERSIGYRSSVFLSSPNFYCVGAGWREMVSSETRDLVSARFAQGASASFRPYE